MLEMGLGGCGVGVGLRVLGRRMEGDLLLLSSAVGVVGSGGGCGGGVGLREKEMKEGEVVGRW